jgi:hypothetical protein
VAVYFNGHFERYEFIIPGAKVVDYFAEQPVDVPKPWLPVVKTIRTGATPPGTPCTACRILDDALGPALASGQRQFHGGLRTPEPTGLRGVPGGALPEVIYDASFLIRKDRTMPTARHDVPPPGHQQPQGVSAVWAP